jgi:hypothetical protein
MKHIDINHSISSLVKNHPEIKDILYGLGFIEIVKPQMLNTVGRFMTIKQGCTFRQIDLNLVIDTFKLNGFDIEGV